MSVIYDKGMKKLLITEEKNIQKFCIKTDSNYYAVDKYFNDCQFNKKPFITINKGRTFSIIDIDCLTLPRTWDDYVNKNITIDVAFNLALERMGITKNRLYVCGLGYTAVFYVRNEYAEVLAEFFYNYYDIWLRRMIHDSKVQLKEKSKRYKLLKRYRDDIGKASEIENLENEIKRLQSILNA